MNATGKRSASSADGSLAWYDSVFRLCCRTQYSTRKLISGCCGIESFVLSFHERFCQSACGPLAHP